MPVDHIVVIGQHLFSPAHVTVLALFPLVAVPGLQPILPLLPFLVGGLDGQEGAVRFEAETLPLLIRIDSFAVPCGTLRQFLKLAVAGRAVAPLVEYRAVGGGHGTVDHIVIGAKNHNGVTPRRGLPFQHRREPAGAIGFFDDVPDLVAVVAADAVPFGTG